MQTHHFRRFRQNALFSAGDKATVSQNHRFKNPDKQKKILHPEDPFRTKLRKFRCSSSISEDFLPNLISEEKGQSHY